MDAIVNKYATPLGAQSSLIDEQEEEFLNSEVASGVPSISLPPISRV